MNNNHYFFAKTVKVIKYCNTEIFLFTGSGFELPTEVQPTLGEHDFNKCENCMGTHKKVFNQIKKRFDVFPLCCTHHAKLVKQEWFNKASFGNIPLMVANKVIYTYQHIINNLKTENWFKEITDYFDAIVMSFGDLPPEFGEPLYRKTFFLYIKELVINSTNIPLSKQKKVLEYVNSYLTTKKDQTTDFTILIQTYEKWLNTFPFDISYFKDLKRRFEHQIPILKDPPEYNKYTGLSKAKLQTKSGLIEAIVKITNNLLTEINGVVLLEKGLIPDANKLKLELVIESRKFRLKQGYITNSISEDKGYRRILKEWFKDEKTFIDEITPLLKNLPTSDIKKEPEVSSPSQKFNALNLIKIELQDRLVSIENKMSSQVETWNRGKDKIGCAAFCEVLFDKLFFEKDATRIKSINQFALGRYGIDIKTQLKSAKKRDRTKRKTTFMKSSIWV